MLPKWLASSFGASRELDDAKRERVLVVVQLAGGNDGLNTVVPKCNGAYYKARPKLAIAPEKTLALDDAFGLHPSLAPLHARFERGEVAVLHGVGYPKPSRSHFRSMDVWHTARLDGDVAGAGWIGRGLDGVGSSGLAPALATNLGSSVPRAIRRDDASVLSFDSEASLELAADRNHAAGRALQLETFKKIVSAERGEHASIKLEDMRRTADAALSNSEAVLACFERTTNKSDYPDNLGKRLALAARLIVGGLGSRVVYIAIGGFDTHAKQLDAHAKLLSNFAKAVDAFFDDLAKQGVAERVALCAFSEFGRRLEENASAGTDHGTAAPMFIAGPRVRGGIHGDALDLDHLADGDPIYTTDFRRVYATLLEDWLGLQSGPALGEDFDRMPLFA